MIQIKAAYKKFEKVDALEKLTLNIKDGEIFGLIGTNGSGKTTLLKLISGILRPDGGCIEIDGEPVYENLELKKDIFLIPDDAYFPNGYTGRDMKNFYQMYYPKFDEERYKDLMERFGLDEKRKIQNLSKGMKKQLHMILGLCAKTKYLLLDETFDGLDPVMRQAVKSLLADEICQREFTPIIASHNLRELEDICQYVGLLHKGNVLLSDEMDELKSKLHKVQCVFPNDEKEKVFEKLNIKKYKQQGSLYLFTVKGDKEEIMSVIEESHPIYCEMIPLSLEEMFISEAEEVGYEVKNQLY